jgi:hypothetical protein
MRRVQRVALDTSRGRTLEIVKHLYAAGDTGLNLGSVAVLTNQGKEKEGQLLRFLRRLGATEPFNVQTDSQIIKGEVRWRLTTRLRALYEEAVAPSGPLELS